MEVDEGAGVDSVGEAQRRACKELRQAVSDLSLRGLKLSAKWAAEQLNALPAAVGSQSPDGAIPEDVGMHADVLLLARSLFDLGEYWRASATIASSGTRLSDLPPLVLFFQLYSFYLAGEKQKSEESLRPVQPGKRSRVNPNLPKLLDELAALHAAKKLDGFGLWLFGLVVRELSGNGGSDPADLPGAPSALTARQLFTLSVKAYPWNWSAWLDLATACLDYDGTLDDFASDSYTLQFQFFLQHLWLEQQHTTEALQILDELAVVFPRGAYIMAQQALAHYLARDFERSHELFEEVTTRDPLRIDLMDAFSNILYVKERRADLSRLAHRAMEIDKYRPETCCIVGNYYSLKGRHETAVTYFMRALKLNSRYLSAWTLMGHEFVELKNTGAAIEAYRKAVDINPKDYRAWYGLGQTYEILQMYLYALYYYRKATTLKPEDARMWTAMGSCYEQLSRRGEAIKAYERAAASGDDREGLSVAKLAKLYAQEGQDERAARCYTRLLQRPDHANSPTIGEALLFLANFYRSSDIQLAMSYATRVLDLPGREKEEARAILRELRSLAAREADKIKVEGSSAAAAPSQPQAPNAPQLWRNPR